MNPPTRRSVLAGVAAALSTAGCLSDSDDAAEGTTATARTRRTATTERTEGTARTTGETTADGTTTHVDFWTRASNEPDPDHRIIVTSEASEERAVRVRVVREATGETVFDETRDIPAGEEARPYNLRRADPDGIESFRVCAEAVADSARTRECVTIETNACYGDALLTVREESLGATYSVC